jgi:hypothetical protein
MQNQALVFLLVLMVLLVALPPAVAKVLAKLSGDAGEQKSAGLPPSKGRVVR